MIYYRAKKDFYGIIEGELITLNELKRGYYYNKSLNSFIMSHLKQLFDLVEYKKTQVITIFGVRQLKK